VSECEPRDSLLSSRATRYSRRPLYRLRLTPPRLRNIGLFACILIEIKLLPPAAVE
jgi:hypothetical protein